MGAFNAWQTGGGREREAETFRPKSTLQWPTAEEREWKKKQWHDDVATMRYGMGMSTRIA